MTGTDERKLNYMISYITIQTMCFCAVLCNKSYWLCPHHHWEQWVSLSLYDTAVISLVPLGFLFGGWRFLLVVLRSSVVENVLEDVFALTSW